MTTPSSNVGADASREWQPRGVSDHDAIGYLIELAGEQFGNGDLGKAAKLLREAARRCDPTSHEWQPIETAPKVEHEAIILWNGKEVTGGAFWEGGWADWYHDWMDPQPTHWMPLPTPPAGEQK